MKLAVYPGSFDPVTRGHIDILEKTSRLFDQIIIAVVHNVHKKALFTLEERVEMIKESTSHLPNVQVEAFTGLLVDYIRKKNACAIIRGLRTVSDFEYEATMAFMNKNLLPDVDTIFVMSRPEYIFISSSGVKEAALLGGDVSTMVPPAVEKKLREKLK
ncbi:Phosphopantetheine adenylyltransferase [Thermosyntropha lipolytica DSM 11003]|uniref:Phosphopantetheine adenylyltransferase n=1 Tax=Thermosyntropha lipolytica DSM 11003 TaxID=1123382 RepID=A0A1M5P4I5_9FIRM|nr:pantetheine-phosphate adenylyltransferase [Thermosyntropha lipolytica]SHG96645.1 Phosphopantetheine adenylyltransferase [Thermosyntropha lipolytica DSM 11003]